MSEEVQPAKRGPGRPRKPAPPKPDVPAVEHRPADKSPVPESDDRVGLSVDPLWTSITYDDGRSYRCRSGKITERVR